MSKIIGNNRRPEDEKIFENLFVSNYKYLCNYAYYFLHETEESKEIVQDVFVKFWEKADFHLPVNSLKSYLFSAVRNACLDFLKHHTVEKAYRNKILLECSETTEENFEKILFKELSGKLEEAVMSLPAQCQKVFRLSRFESKKNKEIAAELNISVKAVEAHIGKALQIIRNKLGDSYGLVMISLILLQEF